MVCAIPEDDEQLLNDLSVMEHVESAPDMLIWNNGYTCVVFCNYGSGDRLILNGSPHFCVIYAWYDDTLLPV